MARAVLRVRIRVLDIGDNLVRGASYSDLYASSDTYVVNTAGVLVSPSHFEQELKAAGRIEQRSMLELQVREPNGGDLTGAFRQSRELLTSPPAGSTPRRSSEFPAPPARCAGTCFR